MTLKNLPTTIPIFPLTGAILLPKGYLPLNIFELRYKEMVNFAAKNDNIIGMIQPRGSNIGTDIQNNDLFGTAERGRDVYNIGCAGVISEIKTTNDDQYFILLNGIRRFKITQELPLRHNFREVEVNYKPFETDGNFILHEGNPLKEKLLRTLSSYFKYLEMKIDLKSFENIEDEELINSLTMICPFEAAEKQMLIETISLNQRAELIIKIIDFNLIKHNVSSEKNIH